MCGKRQKIQYSLALEPIARGEAPASGHPGVEPGMAPSAPENPALKEQLMEEVCECAFRRKATSDSDPKRPLIPI